MELAPPRDDSELDKTLEIIQNAQKVACDAPRDLIQDENEELKTIMRENPRMEELEGCFFVNQPHKIIGACKDIQEELLYLVAYKCTKEEAYTAQWVHGFICELECPQLVCRYHREALEIV